MDHEQRDAIGLHEMQKNVVSELEKRTVEYALSRFDYGFIHQIISGMDAEALKQAVLEYVNKRWAETPFRKS